MYLSKQKQTICTHIFCKIRTTIRMKLESTVSHTCIQRKNEHQMKKKKKMKQDITNIVLFFNGTGYWS